MLEKSWFKPVPNRFYRFVLQVLVSERRFRKLNDFQLKEEWAARDPEVKGHRTLKDLKIGILGVGKMGNQIARAFKVNNPLALFSGPIYLKSPFLRSRYEIFIALHLPISFLAEMERLTLRSTGFISMRTGFNDVKSVKKLIFSIVVTRLVDPRCQSMKSVLFWTRVQWLYNFLKSFCSTSFATN